MPDRPNDIDLLRRSPLLTHAGQGVAARLLAAGTPLRRGRGSVLFAEGEQPAFVYLLQAGSVGLRAQDETGAGTILEILGPGQVFVAAAAMLGLPYPVSAVALTELQALAIPAEAFRAAVAEDPGLNRATMDLLGRQWRVLVDELVDLKLRPAEKRVARFLAGRVPEELDAGTAELPEPRAAIAARLGMTPETLSRALAALEARGLIRMSAKRAEVPDRMRLLF